MGGGTKLSDDELPSVSDELSSSSSSQLDSSSVPSTYSPSSRELVAYLDLLQSYYRPPDRSADLRPLKNSIARHKPGDWIDHVGGMTLYDYDIPESTILLLVGPRGSGKSSLVNRIARVFGNELFAPDPAQVSHNLSATDGTCFLQEYMVLKDSESLCVYDSRSLSESSSENFEMLERWMTEGVSHGQMVVRTSDTKPMKQRMGIMARHRDFSPCLKRTVNFVIFVVDGVSVLKSMDDDAKYNKMLAANFNCPYFSFKDTKPVVVVTHGDELSFQERARVRAHLGEILGIPPSKQIFDIPDTCVSYRTGHNGHVTLFY
ncbi:uncharacterized protein M6B38_318350 [Iris pallida]|uniref:Uncharacterized protein n=1 Tax=Iris pallida TaxID=29817 RepID=A0AAX6HC40_IRIPA|nr:uncharacterized protein M6B38_318350 [Iris pallida]